MSYIVILLVFQMVFLFPFDDLVKVLRLLYPRAVSIELSILY